MVMVALNRRRCVVIAVVAVVAVAGASVCVVLFRTKELLAYKADQLAVNDYERRLMNVSRYSIVRPGERIAYSRTNGGVQIHVREQ